MFSFSIQNFQVFIVYIRILRSSPLYIPSPSYQKHLNTHEDNVEYDVTNKKIKIPQSFLYIPFFFHIVIKVEINMLMWQQTDL
jgi:hypothetical protein